MNRRTSAWAAAHAQAGARLGGKALSLLLSLVLCLTLLPGAALAAETGYGFSINGTPVSDQNIHDYAALGVRATDSSKAYSIDYDTEAKTLTLKNVTITGISNYFKGKKVLDCSTAVNTIELKGKNVINGQVVSPVTTSGDAIAGIRTFSVLTIKGGSRSDSLQIAMPEYQINHGISMYGIYAENGSLTIQDCTLDIVCAGETTHAESATNAIYTKNNNDITIANADVTAVIGKNPENDTITAIRGGSAIYADGGTLRITDSTVTAGAYSNRQNGAYKYTALEGKAIRLTNCELALTGNSEYPSTAARALHTNKSDGSITLTNCAGTLTGSDYGIHIANPTNATLSISGGDLTITGGDNAILTTGEKPVFTEVTVKSGADADSAQEVDLTTTTEKFWEEKYLNTTRPITSVAINDTNFPDTNFRAFVSKFDKNQDGELDKDELTAVTTMECRKLGIADLTGIAYFTALEELSCTSNRLTELDVSRNTALKKLYCGKNQLTSLNVSGNVALEKLFCFKNRLAALDVSKSTELNTLNCSHNQLTSLNLSVNTKLTNLDTEENAYEIQPNTNGTFDLSALPGFDVNKASDWKGGTVNGNTLTVDENAVLVTYTYSLGREVDGKSTVDFTLMIKDADTGIAIDEAHFPDAAFRAYLRDPDSNIDRNQDGVLSAGEIALVREIDVYDESDIKSLEGIEYFTALTYLDCHGCNLTSLDLSKNAELKDLSADDNTYEIEPDADGKIVLSTLPGKFDESKASEWNGGTVENGILTVNKDAEEVTYLYNCGNNRSVTFTLKIAKKYTVTAYGLYGGVMGIEPGETYTRKYAEGESIGLQIGKREGYTLESLTLEGITEKDLKWQAKEYEVTTRGISFTMPGNDVTITVNWVKNSSSSSGGSSGSSTYPITAPRAENGSVTVSPSRAAKGSTVTVTVAPDKGYVLEALTVLDKDGKELKLTEKDGKYTFTMPAGKVEVKATFMDDNTMLNFFVDVKPGDYYYDAVLWAAKKGITSGTDAVHFSPNQPCTRAQIVTFLWRAAGSPVVNYAMSMDDVNESSYYAEAVRWALSEGITGGTGDGQFSPGATCTREQAVTFLYRASGSPAVSGGSAFGDVAENAYYADAVAWAEKNEITGGIGGGLFGSGNDCTRGQIVTLLYRAYSE